MINISFRQINRGVAPAIWWKPCLPRQHSQGAREEKWPSKPVKCSFPCLLPLSTRLCGTCVDRHGWQTRRNRSHVGQGTLDGHNGSLPPTNTQMQTHKHKSTHANPDSYVWWGGVDSSCWWLTSHKCSAHPLWVLWVCVLISIYHGNCSQGWKQQPGPTCHHLFASGKVNKVFVSCVSSALKQRHLHLGPSLWI